LLYTESHEWVQKLGNGTARVGITDYAQNELGDLVYINLPILSSTIAMGEVMADVESVKAVSDIICPVAGTVNAVNEDLLDSPELINESPYDAWIAEIGDIADFNGLMSADDYALICEK
ncbi:MAG: glycine cleavage system protein GcvH, partial [Oscillospiraceae bacterium]